MKEPFLQKDKPPKHHQPASRTSEQRTQQEKPKIGIAFQQKHGTKPRKKQNKTKTTPKTQNGTK